MAFTPNESFLGEKCEHCGYGTMVEPLDFNEWWTRCNDCNAYKFCYVPMEHQERFHADSHKFRMWGGGFG